MKNMKIFHNYFSCLTFDFKLASALSYLRINLSSKSELSIFRSSIPLQRSLFANNFFNFSLLRKKYFSSHVRAFAHLLLCCERKKHAFLHGPGSSSCSMDKYPLVDWHIVVNHTVDIQHIYSPGQHITSNENSYLQK